MSYSMQISVLVHDTDARHIARPSSVWRWLQEAANRQMLTEGPSYDDLMQRGLSFLLSRMAVELFRPIRQYEDLTVTTFTLPSRGVSFERGYRLTDAAGNLVACGRSVWALLDLQSGRFARVDAAGVDYSGGEEPPLSYPVRFLIPAGVELTDVGRRPVYYSDCDVNRHINNTGYADLLTDFLPDPGKGDLLGIAISFRREAPLGSTLSILRGEETTPEGNVRTYFRTLIGGEINVEAMMDVRPTE